MPGLAAAVHPGRAGTLDHAVTATLPHVSDVAALLPTSSGDVLVIPHVLPLRIPAEALTLTVAEWLGLDTPRSGDLAL